MFPNPHSHFSIRSARPSRVALALTAILLVGFALTTGTVSVAVGKPVSASTTKTYKNPVYKHDFADPFILRVGTLYYAYATGPRTCTSHFQALHSRDLVHWTPAPDPMPDVPQWATGKCLTWAPEVLKRPDGQFVFYYVAHAKNGDKQCVGRAVSHSPGGPFVDASAAPLVCQIDLGGSIDPSPFRDGNGTIFLLWKNDGNCCGKHTYIWVQQLTPDGLTLVGSPTSLDRESHDWEGNLIEAPTMWRHGRKYYLFFSANNYASFSYAAGYAVCKSATGPCKDAPENPILSSRCDAAGPGGQTLVTDKKGQTWIVYHAWPLRHIDDKYGPGRVLWLDRLNWRKGKPVVHGPTCKVQPAPAS
ncbi:MAG: hypothetical protein NVSMB52_03200 [Chloroflexota bacterium]